MLRVAPSTMRLTSQFSGRIGADNVVRCPFPDVTIPDKNLCSFLFERFDQFSQSTALVDAVSGREVTYQQLHEETARVCSGLSRVGFGRGDVLVLVSPNSLEYPNLFLATLAMGGVVSTCNPSFTADELAFQFKNSGCKIVATIPSILPTVQQAAEKASVKQIIVVDDSNQKHRDLISYRSLLQDTGSRFQVVEVNSKEEIAVLPYSSGTTGFPKGVMLTHHNVVSNICQIGHSETTGLERFQPLLGILPFFHIYGMVTVLFNSILNGAKTVVLPKFEPEMFLSAIQRYKPTIGHIVPPIVLFLAKHPQVAKYDLSSMKRVITGAAPLGGDIVQAARDRLGIKFQQAYGLTETSPATHIMPVSICETKPQSVGPPVMNQLVKVTDVSSGKVLGAEQDGEIMIRGPNIMKGYLNQPDATKATITDDGWLLTGDIGHYDQDGHFYITDRLKELIKVKGFQVAPAELEALLQHHPKISDAAVVGIPHERLGEAPKGFVVRGDSSLTEEEVQLFVKEKVSEHKWLAGGVEFIEQVPKSASGKILRRNLKKISV